MGDAVKAGSLRHLVEIQKPLDRQTEYGETETTWHRVATCDASITPLSAREFFAAQQVQADVSHRIVVRYVPCIGPQMRVVWCHRIFHIESVINTDERGVMLELLCKETV
jgi:SPP1 family predicted phage head-tail adaptor